MRAQSAIRTLFLVLLATGMVACSTGRELQPGDCVDIVGTGSSEATERLVTVDCDVVDKLGIFQVLWVREAADSEPLTVTLLAAECAGPTLLPDADMLERGDRSVVCFEMLE